MKVSAINSFSPSVNFEKRERKANEVSRGHQTNPMKAVPLAVLIAMSPLDSVDTKAQKVDNANHPVNILVETGKNLGSMDAYPGTPSLFYNDLYKSCKIDFYSTDGNDSNVEKVLLNFYEYEDDENGKEQILLNEVMLPETLTTTIVKQHNKKINNDSEYRRYNVSGPQIEIWKENKALNGEPAWRITDVDYHYKSSQDISKKFYDELSNMLGEECKYETVVVYDTIGLPRRSMPTVVKTVK